jgi:hypothetical protein
MSGFIDNQLRNLAKNMVRAQRKLAMMDLEGEVVAQDVANGLIRMALTPDPTTGAQVLGPWVKPQPLANQAGFKLSAPLPPVGTRMRLHSPSGVVGAASYAAPSYPDAGLPGPTQQPGQAVLSFGSTAMTFADGSVTMTVGGKGYTLTASGMQMSNKFTAEGGSAPTNGNSNLIS